MGTQLRLELNEAGADAARLDELAGYLRSELLELDVDSVTRLPGEPPPPGSKGLDAAVIGGLLVSLSQVGTDLPPVIALVRQWLARGDSGTPRAVRLELDGDVLEVSAASATQQDQLIGLFVDRHRPQG